MGPSPQLTTGSLAMANPYKSPHSVDDRKSGDSTNKFILAGIVIGVSFAVLVSSLVLASMIRSGASPPPVWLNVYLPCAACFIFWATVAGFVGSWIGSLLDCLWKIAVRRLFVKQP